MPPPVKPGTSRPSASLYRSRQVTGLLIVGSVILAFAIARANWHDLFPAGWWRIW